MGRDVRFSKSLYPSIILERYRLAFMYLPTVEKPPTLSAGRKILVAVKAAHYRQPQSFGDMVLTDRGLTTEIAQFQLGDLTFKVHTPHWTKRFAQKSSSLNPIPRTYYFA
jgi:hypothetical protein